MVVRIGRCGLVRGRVRDVLFLGRMVVGSVGWLGVWANLQVGNRPLGEMDFGLERTFWPVGSQISRLVVDISWVSIVPSRTLSSYFPCIYTIRPTVLPTNRRSAAHVNRPFRLPCIRKAPLVESRA